MFHRCSLPRQALPMNWLERFLETCPGPGFDPHLEALCAGLPVEDAEALREERAAILEHLAGLPRAEAEAHAGLGRPPSRVLPGPLDGGNSDPGPSRVYALGKWALHP